MAEKCVVKLVFETDKKPIARYWCRYDDGTSLEGHGEKLTGLVIDTIEKLTKDIIIFRFNSSLFDSKHKNNKVGIGLFISINTLI